MALTDRRSFIAGAAAAAAAVALPGLARVQATPGVTATELKVGTTTSPSGPVAALGTINKAQAAYFKVLNEQGCIAGRKIDYRVKAYKAFMAKSFADGNANEFYNACGYMVARVMHRPLEPLQMTRWNAKQWERLGAMIHVANV